MGPLQAPDEKKGSALSVSDAFRTTLDLFETGLDLMRQNLRRSHPDAGDEQIERLLSDWLLDRPGPPSRDFPGRPVDRLA